MSSIAQDQMDAISFAMDMSRKRTAVYAVWRSRDGFHVRDGERSDTPPPGWVKVGVTSNDGYWFTFDKDYNPLENYNA